MMRKAKPRLIAGLAVVSIAALVLSACSSSKASSGSTGSSAPTGAGGVVTQSLAPTTAPTSTTYNGVSIDTSGTDCPTTSGAGSGQASDVGVTANQIKVGMVAEFTAPVPGLADGAKAAAEAYFACVNSHGGIYGRKLVLDARDDAGNPAQVSTETKSLSNSAFALVDGPSLYDSAFLPAINAAKMPSYITMNTKAGVNDPYVISGQASQVNYATAGYFKYFAEKYPDAVKKAAYTYGSGESDLAQASQSAAEQAGWKFVYTRGVGLTDTNFLSDALKMKSLGVKIVFLRALSSGQQMVDEIKALKQNGLDAILLAQSAYYKNMPTLAGTAADGVYVTMPYAMFNGEDASSTPDVALMQKWLAQADPSYTGGDFFLMLGWLNAELLVQSLVAVGPNPTRAAMIQYAKTLTSWPTNGIAAQSNVAGALPTQCWLLMQVGNGGHYQRVAPSPSQGFVCDPGGLYSPTGSVVPLARP